MEALRRIIEVPSWAYDFCWYYFAVAALMAIYAIWSIVSLLMLPGIVKRFVPTMGLVIGNALSAVLLIVVAMMQFWICRSALAPGKKEAFAVACKSGTDCTAVMGTPQPSTCTCSGRGFCGGCVMQNNMEPATLQGYE